MSIARNVYIVEWVFTIFSGFLGLIVFFSLFTLLHGTSELYMEKPDQYAYRILLEYVFLLFGIIGLFCLGLQLSFNVLLTRGVRERKVHYLELWTMIQWTVIWFTIIAILGCIFVEVKERLPGGLFIGLVLFLLYRAFTLSFITDVIHEYKSNTTFEVKFEEVVSGSRSIIMASNKSINENSEKSADDAKPSTSSTK